MSFLRGGFSRFYVLCDGDKPRPNVGDEFQVPVEGGRDWWTLGKVTAARLIATGEVELTIEVDEAAGASTNPVEEEGPS